MSRKHRRKLRQKEAALQRRIAVLRQSNEELSNKESSPTVRKARGSLATALLSMPGRLIAVLSVVASLLALLVLWPRVTVTVSDPPNRNDLFSSSVTVTNAGYLPLSYAFGFVSIRKIVNEQDGRTFTVHGAPDNLGQLARSDAPPRWLSMDDSFTIAMNDMIHSEAKIRSADIGVVVHYKIPFIGLNREKVFPLFARQQTDGNFYWYHDSPPG